MVSQEIYQASPRRSEKISSNRSKEAAYILDAATPEDVDWIALLEAEVYSPEDAIPREIIKEWYSRNPSGFFIVKARGGERIGHIDILPVRPEPLQKFLDGTIVERDIRGDDLYSPEEREHVRNLYIESFAIPTSTARSNAPAIKYLIENFDALLSRVCIPAKVENIYAIAATMRGDRFLKHLGFKQIQDSKDRVDRHNLFAVKLVDLISKIEEIKPTASHRTQGVR